MRGSLHHPLRGLGRCLGPNRARRLLAACASLLLAGLPAAALADRADNDHGNIVVKDSIKGDLI